MNDSFADHLETLIVPLSVNEVADLLGVHRDTIYRWVRDGELPAINVGATKTILRFPPKELAAWVRARQEAFHGPARHISDWMEEQALRRGGPCFLPPLLPKVLRSTGYDWMATAQRVATDPNFAFAAQPLMDDFTAAVNDLSVPEQRELLSDIKTGKFDEPIFTDQDQD
jgi:excisionase family DNA binding protein